MASFFSEGSDSAGEPCRSFSSSCAEQILQYDGKLKSIKT